MHSEGLEKNNFFLSACFIILAALSTLFTQIIDMQGVIYGTSAMIINVRLYKILVKALLSGEKKDIPIVLLTVMIKVPFLFFQVYMLSHREVKFVLSSFTGLISVIGAGLIAAKEETSKETEGG